MKRRIAHDFISNEFGGTLLRSSHAKTHRPISLSRTMHFVFRSDMAKARASFLRKENRQLIEQILKRHKGMIRLKNIQIESGQIQLFFKNKSRTSTQHFLRTFSGLVARAMLGAEKAHAKLKQNRFWNFRPYSRVILQDQESTTDLVQFHLQELQVLAPLNNSS